MDASVAGSSSRDSRTKQVALVAELFGAPRRAEDLAARAKNAARACRHEENSDTEESDLEEGDEDSSEASGRRGRAGAVDADMGLSENWVPEALEVFGSELLHYRDGEGRTLLHSATGRPRQQLIEAGGDPKARDHWGVLAEESGQREDHEENNSDLESASKTAGDLGTRPVLSGQTAMTCFRDAVADRRWKAVGESLVALLPSGSTWAGVARVAAPNEQEDHSREKKHTGAYGFLRSGSTFSDREGNGKKYRSVTHVWFRNMKDVVARSPSLPESVINAREVATGRTALHFAARHGLVQFCVFLLEIGADATAADVSGEMAAEVASRYGHDRLAKSLRAVAAAQEARLVGTRGRLLPELELRVAACLGPIDIGRIKSAVTVENYFKFFLMVQVHEQKCIMPTIVSLRKHLGGRCLSSSSERTAHFCSTLIYLSRSSPQFP